jgi:hypothetical protein
MQSANSRVWIYQCNRPFTAKEQVEIELQLTQFAKDWVSHSHQLVANAEILHNQFIVLSVDESMIGASGCSVDSSVRFLKQLETTYQISLFDRLNFTYLKNEKVITVDNGTFVEQYKNGEINDETLVFDTLVNTKQNLDNAFIKPLKESWHKRMV